MVYSRERWRTLTEPIVLAVRQSVNTILAPAAVPASLVNHGRKKPARGLAVLVIPLNSLLKFAPFAVILRPQAEESAFQGKQKADSSLRSE